MRIDNKYENKAEIFEQDGSLLLKLGLNKMVNGIPMFLEIPKINLSTVRIENIKNGYVDFIVHPLDRVFCTLTDITYEQQPKELTIKDIEKQLGYKVKIVGENNG